MTKSTILDVHGLNWASSTAVVEATLLRRPGVTSVEANAVNQTATVVYDPATTSVADLAGWIRDCGFHCAGRSVPDHVCDPMSEPHHHPSATLHEQPTSAPSPTAGEVHAHEAAPARTPQEAMGHGGGHAGMSMDHMVRDMRNRFLVALALSIPIMLWSPMGRDMFGFTVPAPFGLRDDVFTLLLSLPVVFYSAWIFFDGAWRALRARTLDMMVLVAVAVGAGWLYSLGVTLTGGGEVFYEAASVLTAFVLLGHWFEMRARGGANDAIRTLLELAPPMAVVLRDGEPVETPTAEVAVGDLLLIRPGAKIPVDGTVAEGTSDVGHRGKPAGVKGAGLEGDWRLDQHHRHVAGRGNEGRLRHGAGTDRRDGSGSAELQSPRAAVRRPGSVLAGSGGADRRHCHLPGVVGGRRRCPDRVAVRHHRRGDHLPRCVGTRDSDRDHGGHRVGRQAGSVVQECDRAGDVGAHRYRRHGQDRHVDQGRA